SGAGGGEDRVQQAIRRWIAQLDLDLAEPVLDAKALDDRHVIIDDLGEHRALAVLELHPAADGGQAGHGHKRGWADVRHHECDRGIGWPVGIAWKLELPSVQRATFGRCRKLERPALT